MNKKYQDGYCYYICIYFLFDRLKLVEFDYSVKCFEIVRIIDGLLGREIFKFGVVWQVRSINVCFVFLL